MQTFFDYAQRQNRTANSMSAGVSRHTRDENAAHNGLMMDAGIHFPCRRSRCRKLGSGNPYADKP
jgi:hypothetical protein